LLAPGNPDKQPEMVGLMPGCGDKLYGGGGADASYAIFGALSALMALKEQEAGKAGRFSALVPSSPLRPPFACGEGD
jgi:hypothetical protein